MYSKREILLFVDFLKALQLPVFFVSFVLVIFFVYDQLRATISLGTLKVTLIKKGSFSCHSGRV